MTAKARWFWALVIVGVANVRFWTFNVADMGITAGAVVLLLALVWKTSGRGLSRSRLGP